MAKLFQSDRILQDSNSKFQEIAERRSQEEDSLLLNFEFAFFVRIITERGLNGITFVPSVWFTLRKIFPTLRDFSSTNPFL